MKLLEMGKDMKIKHSVSSPPTKYEGTFFAKKLCMVERFWANLWGMFYMGTDDQIMQGGMLMVKRFQRSSQVRARLHETRSELRLV